MKNWHQGDVLNVPLQATIFPIGSTFGNREFYKDTEYPIKPHFDFDEAREMILTDKCGVFNPLVLESMKAIEPKMRALYQVAPNLSDLTYPELYEEVPYDGTKLLKVARSAAKVRELYEQALTAAGFELADKYSSILNLTETTYVYQCAKTGITVYYVEKVVLGILRSVSISIW